MDHVTAVYKQDGNWWVGYVEEPLGAHTQGRTLDEAWENLKEATRLIIEPNRELARQDGEGTSVITNLKPQ